MTHRFNAILALLVLLASSVGFQHAAVWAEEQSSPINTAKTLHDLRDPVTVEIQSVLSVKQSKENDVFEATLDQDYASGDRVIPKGTVIRGFVTEVKPSRNFGRPGSVSLSLKEAVLPSGEVHTFKVPQTSVVRHNKAATVPKLLKNALPFMAVGLADGIPLAAATDLAAYVVMPISAGARMTAGAIWEESKKDDRPMYRKIGYGMLRGTGYTGAKAFITKQPEPNFVPLGQQQAAIETDSAHANQTKLKLGGQNTQDLFEFSLKHPSSGVNTVNALPDATDRVEDVQAEKTTRVTLPQLDAQKEYGDHEYPQDKPRF
jgi:hypothetical protein